MEPVVEFEYDPPVREAWMDDAACTQTDPDLFFPEKGEGTSSARDAKRVCSGCEVRETCLAWALERGERHGVLGGLSARERARLRQGRAA